MTQKLSALMAKPNLSGTGSPDLSQVMPLAVDLRMIYKGSISDGFSQMEKRRQKAQDKKKKTNHIKPIKNPPNSKELKESPTHKNPTKNPMTKLSGWSLCLQKLLLYRKK